MATVFGEIVASQKTFASLADKRIFITLLSFLAVALASSDGSIPEDPVFDCLSELSEETFICYRQTYGFLNSHRGGRLGGALGQLVPKDYKTWADKSESERAKACIGSLKNFLEPLRAVVESEQDTGQVCEYSGIELNKTLGGLLRILSRNIHGFRRYVRLHHIHIGTLQLQSVNMAAMTSFAAQQKYTANRHGAVRLRNLVLLEYLDQVLRDIHLHRGCFNTELKLVTACIV